MKRPLIITMLISFVLIAAVCGCSSKQTGSSENGEINYVTRNNTPVFSEADDTSSCIAYVNEGDDVLVMSYSGVFCKVTTSSNKVGYINGRYLSPDDPVTEITTEVSSENEPSVSFSVEETIAPAPVPEPTEASAPTSTPTPIPTPKPARKVVKVRDRYKKTRVFVNSNNTSEKEKVTCKVPEVQISGIDMSAVNEKIYKNLKTSVNSFKKASRNVDDIDYATYEYYVGKGFVSIITWDEYFAFESSTYSCHYVYNIDTSDGHLMTKKEALKKFGISEKKFNNEVSKRISFFWEDPLYNDDDEVVSFNKAAVNKSIPYVNKSGKIFAAVKLLAPDYEYYEYDTKYKVKK